MFKKIKKNEGQKQISKEMLEFSFKKSHSMVIVTQIYTCKKITETHTHNLLYFIVN